MGLPLSQPDEEEILGAYKKTELAINQCVASFEALVAVLEQKIACLDESSKKELGNSFAMIGSSMFRLGVLRYKVEKAGLHERKFRARSSTPLPP